VKIDSTRIATAGAVGLPVTVSLVAFAPAAYAASGDPISDAVSALSSGESYIAPGTDAQDLQGVYDGTAVGVVVLPADEFGTFEPAQIAQQVYNKVSDSYDTVIVVKDDASSATQYGVAPSEIASDVWAVIGDNPNSADGAIGGLAADQGELVSLTSTSADVPAASGGGFDAAPVAVGGGGVILGIAAVVAVTRLVAKRNKNRVRAITTQSIKDREFRHSMERFAELTRIHANEQFPTSAPMRSILTHLNNLFARLEKKGVGNAKQMAEVNYKGILQKLNETLGEDYYIDISKNPKLWDRSSQRTAEVEKALVAVDDQVLENIKQVNASKDLDFRVALETLLSSADRPNASDMIR
jgi:hypothetical protein